MRRRQFLMGGVLLPATALAAFSRGPGNNIAVGRFGIENSAHPKWRGGGGKRNFSVMHQYASSAYTGAGSYESAVAADFTTYVPYKCYNTGSFTWPGGFPPDQDELPTQASVETVADAAVTAGARFLSIDIETYPDTTTSERNSLRDCMRTIIGWAKARQPSLVIGVYAECPGRETTNILTGDGAAGYETWQTNNDEKNFLNAADMVMPSLYFDAGITTVALARQFMTASLVESRRLAGPKPVIPWVWPFWHDENAVRAAAITGFNTGTNTVTVGSDLNIQTGDPVLIYDDNSSQGQSSMVGASEIQNKTYIATRTDARNFVLQSAGTVSAWTSGGTIIGGLNAEYWNAVIDTCAQYADGMCIFNLHVNWPGDTATWWVAQKARNPNQN